MVGTCMLTLIIAHIEVPLDPRLVVDMQVIRYCLLVLANCAISPATHVKRLAPLAGHSKNRDVKSLRDEICDDLIATIPKLHDAVRRDISSDTPRHSIQKKEGVEKYLVPLASGDIDLVHSVVAKTELRCHMNEVLNVLVNQDSSSRRATTKALNGKKFTQGNVLFQQRCKLVPGDTTGSASSRDAAGNQISQSGLISVKLATIKPKFSFKFGYNNKRVQKLCLGTFTHKYPSNDRAVHVVKTLPKPVHDQVVASEDRSALRRELDHLTVGFDIQFFPKPGGGSADQTTRILAHGYASTTSPGAFGSRPKKDSSA
ncbi:hypothetical protein PybrP1_003914, partial [[Pythium] brassicae (nom. inval.)]